MLEICGIVDPRRQDGDSRRNDSRRSDVLQGPEQMAWIITDWTYVAVIKDLGKRALHDLPVLQHIGLTGGTPQVVLENVIVAILVPHKIRADNVAPDPFG